MTYFKNMLFTINSADRIISANSSTNFTVNLPVTANVSKAELMEVQLPNTYYNVNSYNNVLSWNDGSLKTITVPPGAYNINQLVTEIQTLMNSVSSGYTVTYNQIQFTVTITGGAAFSLMMAVSSIAHILGFSSVNITGASSYTGTNVIALNAPINLYIIVSNFGTSGWTSKGIGYTYKVSVTVTGGNLTYNEINSFYPQCITLPIPTGTKNFAITLVDFIGNPVNLNGANWNFTMNLT